ncbi:ABC transporter permease [Kribbella sp. NPDC020789]
MTTTGVSAGPVFLRTFYREYRLIFQNRTTLLLGLLPPVVYILCFVTSMNGMVAEVQYKAGTVDYSTYVLPAVIVMSMVAGATQSATLLFGEEMSGMLTEIFTAPVTKSGFIAGRLICTSSLVLAQALMMFVLASVIVGWRVPPSRLPLVAVSILLVAVCFNLMYLCVATFFRNQQTFLLVMNIGATVLIFAAPTFYTYSSMPTALQWLSWANPVTYGLDVVRSAASGSFGTAGMLSLVIVCALGVVGSAATVSTLSKRVARG